MGFYVFLRDAAVISLDCWLSDLSEQQNLLESLFKARTQEVNSLYKHSGSRIYTVFLKTNLI